tara:strand:- start:102 stop:551 length:450 start_codon:yes stop_codon:yes gene_type:complete
MFKYWTIWNWHWYIGSELGIFSLNGPLCTSIINTSIIGGFMTYIKPRRAVITYKDKDEKVYYYNVPDYQIFLFDLILHQLPLVRMIMREKVPGLCGFYSIAPVLSWMFYNVFNKTPLNSIYDIQFEHLSLSSAIITMIYGYYKHRTIKL